MSSSGGAAVPGNSALVETTEVDLLWGGDAGKGLALWKSGVIQGETRDSGNSPTTVLRPGLVLAKLDADNHYTDYDPDASDGSEVAHAILGDELRAQDFDANDADRVFRVLVGGPVKAGQLQGLDDQARIQLGPRFMFDDDLTGTHNFLGLPWQNDTHTASFTLAASDSGKRIVMNGSGATTVTLPAIASSAGFAIRVLNAADQNVTVTSATTDMVAFNNASATSVAFSTAGNKIGGQVQIEAGWVGTTPKWFVTNLSAGANTITVA